MYIYSFIFLHFDAIRWTQKCIISWVGEFIVMKSRAQVTVKKPIFLWLIKNNQGMRETIRNISEYPTMTLGLSYKVLCLSYAAHFVGNDIFNFCFTFCFFLGKPAHIVHVAYTNLRINKFANERTVLWPKKKNEENDQIYLKKISNFVLIVSLKDLILNWMY